MRKLQVNKTRVSIIAVPPEHVLFLECVCIPLPGVSYSGEFTSPVVIFPYHASMDKQVLLHAACPCDCTQFELVRTLLLR